MDFITDRIAIGNSGDAQDVEALSAEELEQGNSFLPCEGSALG